MEKLFIVCRSNGSQLSQDDAEHRRRKTHVLLQLLQRVFPIKREDCLNADVQGRDLEGFEHYLCQMFPVLWWIEGRLREQHRVLPAVHIQLSANISFVLAAVLAWVTLNEC